MGVFNFRNWVSSCPRCKELGSKEVNSVRHERITGTGGPEAQVQPRKGSEKGLPEEELQGGRGYLSLCAALPGQY